MDMLFVRGDGVILVRSPSEFCCWRIMAAAGLTAISDVTVRPHYLDSPGLWALCQYIFRQHRIHLRIYARYPL